jgi:hypothetical protein
LVLLHFLYWMIGLYGRWGNCHLWLALLFCYITSDIQSAALRTRRSRVWFPMVSLDFFFDIILPVTLWPWGWLSHQQKWVPGIFPGGKGSRCVVPTTLPPSCADCLEIWEPQPPGMPRTCQGL